MSIINAGGQTDYLFGLVSGLRKIQGLQLDVVDSDKSEGLFDGIPNVRFLNLRGDQDPNRPLFVKLKRILRYYVRLLVYVSSTDCTLLHIQWENKFVHIDRTLLNLYYKLLGKKIVFTAHNIDSIARAGKRSVLNSISLWLMYRIVDHVIVHTNKMKQELICTFGLVDSKISVVPFGINIHVPTGGLDQNQARNSLRIPLEKKVMLLFGSIDRYKGIETAVESLSLLLRKDPSYYLVIAGRHKDCEDYVHQLVALIQLRGLAGSVLMHNYFIPHEEVGKYFMAADCCVLPYKRIYQSGVLFLSLAFGLPVIASDVGSFREVIMPGFNGYICRPGSAIDIADGIERYFKGEIYRNLREKRLAISAWAKDRFSWDKIAVQTMQVYEKLMRDG